MRRFKSRLGSSSWISFETDEEMACLNRANNSTQVRQIDAIITDLAKNWKPTGFYRPADVQQMLTMIQTEAEAAAAVLASAPLSTSDAQSAKDRAFKDLLGKYKSNGLSNAVALARQSGATAINAPGFKDFVISGMRSISDAYVTAAVLQCRHSWTEAALDRGYRAMASIGGVAAGLVGVVVKVGESVIDATMLTAKIIATLVRIAPWAAIGIAGLFAVHVVRKRPSWLRRKLPAPVAGWLMPPR